MSTALVLGARRNWGGELGLWEWVLGVAVLDGFPVAGLRIADLGLWLSTVGSNAKVFYAA